MSPTGIEWTQETWNPVTGCSKVSPGCAHCYAETLTARYAGRPGFIEEHRPWTPENAEHNVRLWPERLEQPLRWKRPRMVFVNSMSDLFHEEVPNTFIAEVFAVMALAPQHTFQVLTKRPERMRALLDEHKPSRIFWQHILGAVGKRCREADLPWPCALDCGGLPQVVRPLPNVWLGTSIENRKFVGRAEVLRATPAAVRFISAEPLLGPLIYDGLIDTDGHPAARTSGYLDEADCAELDLTGIDWLIVGGESGPGHRPMKAEWVRDLRNACTAQTTMLHEAAVRSRGGQARTAFFFKQWGGATPKAAGRGLDGRTWDEMPASSKESQR